MRWSAGGSSETNSPANSPRTDRLVAQNTMKNTISNPFGHDLLTLSEASFLTSYSKFTIKRWMYKGYLTRYGSVRKVLVHFQELIGYLERQRTNRVVA